MAGDSSQAPLPDGTALPVVTPADWAILPRAWLANSHRAGAKTHDCALSAYDVEIADYHKG